MKTAAIEIIQSTVSDEQLAQEVTVRLPLRTVLSLVDRQPSAAAAALSRFGSLPAIGTQWRGGMFAGISIHENAPVALILLQGECGEAPWDKANQWAIEQGGNLPSRIDQLVLLHNVKGEFKEAAYWSGAQYAGGSDSAWCQGFYGGNQGSYLKDGTLRARAVRREPIQ